MDRRALLLAVVALAAGCDAAAPSAEGSSCARDDGALCLDFLTVSSDIVAQATCNDVLGPASSFSQGSACPTGLGVGTCDVVEPGVRFSIQYSGPVLTPGDASADCAGRGGTFHPQTIPEQAP